MRHNLMRDTKSISSFVFFIGAGIFLISFIFHWTNYTEDGLVIPNQQGLPERWDKLSGLYFSLAFTGGGILVMILSSFLSNVPIVPYRFESNNNQQQGAFITGAFFFLFSFGMHYLNFYGPVS